MFFIKCINENIYGKYDIVLRYRTDLLFEEELLFQNHLNDSIYLPISCKIKQEENIYCDIFAYGNSEMMNKYFDIFNYIRDNYNDKISSVEYLYKYIKYSNIQVIKIDIKYNIILSMCNIIGITGNSGSGKTLLSKDIEVIMNKSFVLECDRYHKWERNDENWESYTHLDPNANYLLKMHDDIFDLKIHNEIYQVDYDHLTGKFTEIQNIKPSNNIIICGLHTLYMNETNKYLNLKIFMDTQEELNNIWKIKRDINKRGYDLETILYNIEKRKIDYEIYIKPQMLNADIIIRYFTDDKINYNNLDDEYQIKLKITTRFDLSDFIKLLKSSKINFEYEINSIIIFDNNIDIGSIIKNNIILFKNFDFNFDPNSDIKIFKNDYRGLIQLLIYYIIWN